MLCAMASQGAGKRVIDDRFELLERLGGGGMGLVWRARDTELHREVALKEVRPPDPRFEESSGKDAAVLRERVLREARSLAKLRHPHVVTIFHIVTRPETEYPWLVMELVPSGSLADRLDEGPLAPGEAARLGLGLLSGLSAAHAAGILHRDVKPGNVLIREDGSPVLTDFGIAALNETSTLTTSGALIGSPEYIAPERIRGREGDPRSDLWSLGMLLYVAVEGAHPLRRGTALATLAAVLDEPVPPPTRAGPLTDVLAALMSRDPNSRPDAARCAQLLAEAEARAEAEAQVAEAAEAAATVTSASAVVAVPTLPDAAQVRAPARESGPGPAPAAAGYAALTTRTNRAVAAEQPPAERHEPAERDEVPDRRDEPSPKPRRFRPVLRLVKTLTWVVALLALIGAAVNYLPDWVSEAAEGGGPVTGGEQKKDSDQYLFTPEGIRKAVAVLRPMIGGSKVSSMSTHGSHLTVAAPRKDKPEVMHWYTYRDGKAEDGGPAGVVERPPRLDLSTVDWDVLPGLWREAQNSLGIKNAERSHVSVGIDADGEVQLSMFVRDEYGGAHLNGDGRGKVTERYPRKTVSERP